MSVRSVARPLAGVSVAALFAIWFGFGAPMAGQRPAAPAPESVPQDRQFRAGTDTVPVYVTVRDSLHMFVTELTQQDFEIRDNGKVQPITQFALDVQPLSVLILIDGSGSMMPEFNRALEGASSFVLRMLPADRVRIGSFADRIAFSPEFTSNRDELLGYLHDEFNLRVGDETHLWEAMLDGTRLLSDERGKRVVLVLSDGYNFVLPPGANQSAPAGPGKGRPPIAGGPNGGPIGLGGRNPTGGTSPGGSAPMPMPPSFSDPQHYGVPLDLVWDSALQTDTLVFAVSMWVRDGASKVRPSHELERLAIDTGGGFYEVDPAEDMFAPFANIAQQLRQQYVLGFTPKVLDGKRHKLDVRVKRPNVEVRARGSYVAGKTPPAR